MIVRFVSLAVLIVLLAIGAASFASAQHIRERVIQRLPVEKGEPITITEIKLNNKSIAFGRRFLADDDWLRGLSISVKNASDKRILFASLLLVIPGPADSKDRVAIFDVSHGNVPLMTRRPTPSEQMVGIMPGDTVEIALSTQDFVDLQELLAGTRHAAGIDEVQLKIGHVIFEDDTMWYAGTHLRRDLNNPSAWLTSAEK